LEIHRRQKSSLQNRNKSNDGIFKLNQRAPKKFLRVGNIPPLHGEEEHLCQNVRSVTVMKRAHEH